MILAAGALARAAVIVLTRGEYWDIRAIALVGDAFLRSPLHVYALDAKPAMVQGQPAYPWPYMPGFLPIAGLLSWLSHHLGVTVNHLERALMGMVDLVMAWLVQWLLGRAGRSERERLIAAALIAFGPTFIAVSAVHGQIDALAWLPAVAALGLWELRAGRSRAFACGALVGIGIVVKTTPGLVLLALGATARSRRELLALTVSAALVVALAVLPFALVAPSGMGAIVHYQGFAGRAGLSLLFQPRLALADLTGTPVSYDATTRFLVAHAALLVLVSVALVLAIVRLGGLDSCTAAIASVLAVYVFGAAILPQYWLWLVPLLILAGRRLAALVYQLALLPMLVAIYGFLQEPDQPARHLSRGLVLYGYIPLLWLVTLGMLGWLAWLLTRPRDAALASGAAGVRSAGCEDHGDRRNGGPSPAERAPGMRAARRCETPVPPPG